MLTESRAQTAGERRERDQRHHQEVQGGCESHSGVAAVVHEKNQFYPEIRKTEKPFLFSK